MKINCFTKTEEEMNVLLVEEKVGELYTLSKDQETSATTISPALSVRNDVKKSMLKDMIAEDMKNFLLSYMKPGGTEAVFECSGDGFFKTDSEVNLNLSFRWKEEKGWQTLLIGLVRCELEKHDDRSIWLSKTTLIFYEIDEKFWKKIRLKTIL